MSTQTHPAEPAKVIGQIPAGEMWRLIGLRPDDIRQARLNQALQAVIRGMLAGLVEIQLAIGRGAMAQSPGERDRHQVFEQIQALQRTVRLLLAPSPAPADEASRAIVEGYRKDITEQLSGVLEILDIPFTAADLLAYGQTPDEELRRLGAAARELGVRITTYLSVKAAVS